MGQQPSDWNKWNGTKGTWVVEKAKKARGVHLAHLTCTSLKQRSKALSVLVSWWAAVKGGRQSAISLCLALSRCQHNALAAAECCAPGSLQRRVLVSLLQLDDTGLGGDNEPYKGK